MVSVFGNVGELANSVFDAHVVPDDVDGTIVEGKVALLDKAASLYN